jgi:hypothetical protein
VKEDMISLVCIEDTKKYDIPQYHFPAFLGITNSKNKQANARANKVMHRDLSRVTTRSRLKEMLRKLQPACFPSSVQERKTPVRLPFL